MKVPRHEKRNELSVIRERSALNFKGLTLPSLFHACFINTSISELTSNSSKVDYTWTSFLHWSVNILRGLWRGLFEGREALCVTAQGDGRTWWVGCVHGPEGQAWLWPSCTGPRGVPLRWDRNRAERTLGKQLVLCLTSGATGVQKGKTAYLGSHPLLMTNSEAW